MAAYGGSFESADSIEERKESKRIARQHALEKAKQQHDKEERIKELKRQRGEDTWMLPEVNQRLQHIEQEVSVKKKKKEKKAKKSKKEKKKKAKKEDKKSVGGGNSDESSQESEEEWVEAQRLPKPTKAWKIPSEAKPAESSDGPANNVQRDDWMTFDFLTMRTTSTADRRAEKERLKEEEQAKAQALEQAGLHKLELNPYWKDGGSGLPPQEKAATAPKRAAVVDDGGLSWLRKSYQRMKEQADREQRNLGDLVAERYGSMEQFQKRLAEAETAAHARRRGGGGRRGEEEEEEDGAWRGRRRRGEEESWERRRGEGVERERWRRRDGDLSPGQERHRDGREESGENDRPQERGHGAGRGRDGERGRHRDGDRERDRGGDRERDRDGDRERDRERERHRDVDRERDSYGDRERDRERERDRYGDRERDGARGYKSDLRVHREGSSPGPGRSRPPSVSLQSRFLKPSDDEDVGAGKACLPAHPSKVFLKPSSDDEDSGSGHSSHTAGKRGAGPPLVADAPGKQEPESETRTRKDAATIVPQEGRSANSTAVTTSRSESESEEEEEEEELPLLTDEEMNKLGAKLVKAEIMGNTALVEKMKSQLESARKAKENRTIRQKQAASVQSTQDAGCSADGQEVLLFRTDQSGRAWPVNAPSGPLEPRGGRRKKKAIETHVDGERVRYFHDDDSMGLQEMVRREKMSSAQDQNALYSRMAAKMMGKADGEEYTLDDMFVSSAAQREGEGREEERMRSRAVGEHRRLAATVDKCPHCFSSQELKKHLVVALGTKVYLSVPVGVSMTEGHCLICPLQHHCSATGLDEDVWSEMQMFRRALVRMFESQELDCVFMETHMNPRRRQHMILECIPLPKELGDMAPIYFKKAIMDCDEEWAMNKKIVNLSSKDIRQAIPRGLPYFSVDFGLQGGFAHVIENEQKFPHYFGKEVVGGMMDLEPRRWRKSIRESFDDQRKKVLQFSQWWKPFDCMKSDG